MTPTLLDLAQIFGFRPVNAVGDYHRGKNRERLAKPFTISATMINQNCSSSNFLKKSSTEKEKDQQHMLFLLYWLNRFVLPNRSSAVLLKYRHLEEALHNNADVGLGPTILAHLYKNLHSATLESPLNIFAPGALWIIQIWLQVMATPLMSAELPKRSIEEYVIFFRHCTKRSAAQWQVEPEEEEARTDFRKKFLSVTLPRDKPFGGGKPPNYHLGAESYRSCNCATLWRDSDDLDVHKDCRCLVNKINNSVNALYPSWEPNSCSSGELDAWWKAHFAGVLDANTSVFVRRKSRGLMLRAEGMCVNM
ncbi:unnamed protein product [Prunus armeniaca]